jgi:hypothetical protein
MMAAMSVLFAALIFFVVLIPKRRVGRVSERLQQSARGDRVFVFGPPPSFGRGFPGAAASELIRLLELGLPIYLFALRAEAQGHWHRTVLDSRSKTVLPAATKARWTPPRQYTMPPMAWRREWEASLLSRAQASTESALISTSRPTETLRIRTLGMLQIFDGDVDLAPGLASHHVSCFLWLFLLSHAVVHPDVAIQRDLLADEGSPGFDVEQQRARLRGRLRDLMDLPTALTECIEITGETVRFKLDRGAVDVVFLRGAADEWDERPGLLPPDGITEIQGAMARYAGEYLPLWDELEERITGRRGVGGELVRSIRLLAEDAYCRLMLRLAQHHHARRDVARAIPLWEEALRRAPEREDVATLLTAAYRQTGQPTRARRLEFVYHLGRRKPDASPTATE